MGVTFPPAGFDWWPVGLLGDAHLGEVGSYLNASKVIRFLKLGHKGTHCWQRSWVTEKGWMNLDFADLRGRLHLNFNR